jgi:hypothetical protein
MDISVIIILLLLMGAMAAYVPVYMSLFFTGVLGLSSSPRRRRRS